ncbi:Os02g0825850 [Oryza sativa Japonica Group]|uniref:Os02g0825850 protein n=1 Tax=Oryza sativa subsp. japonica TaxID=39947 RepID=A0A0P0VRF9_ORYSJ|nr:hypothetical protein EE612_014590 [Oryza sativa]BAS81685.1 Os02g0825850 [Oryza sativa Japonica Group]
MVPNCDAHLLQGGCSLEKESCLSDITFFWEFIQTQNLQILKNRLQQFWALRMNPNLFTCKVEVQVFYEEDISEELT